MAQRSDSGLSGRQLASSVNMSNGAGTAAGSAAAAAAAAANNLFVFKLVVLGEMAVGKTSLMLQFTKGTFNPKHETTIGAAFLTQTLPVDDGTIKFEIWDTAGQERYHSLAPMYYRGAQAAIIVYDVTNMESFTRAKNWVKELQGSQSLSNVVITLVGNKCDLRDTGRHSVPADMAKQYAESNDLLFLETSAKTGENVRELFDLIASRLPRSAARVPAAAPNDGGGAGVVVSGDAANQGQQQAKEPCCA